MTPLPKRRWSTNRQGRKRATFKAGSIKLVRCKNCGNLNQNHTICKKCGFYNGKQVIKIKEKKDKHSTSSPKE